MSFKMRVAAFAAFARADRGRVRGRRAGRPGVQPACAAAVEGAAMARLRDGRR
jgi:hypothetical protein